jgi:GMP synthase (glutamine-hydrolysing)
VRVLAIVHQADAGLGVFADSLRVAGAEVDSLAPDETAAAPDPVGYDALIILGGAAHPDQNHAWLESERKLIREFLDRLTPTLGVCLGAQLLAQAAGGSARRAPAPEIGWYDVELTDAAYGDPLIGPLGGTFAALEWHSYACELPPQATVLARNDNCVQAYRIGESAWGIQFHAEVTEADFGHWLDTMGTDEDAVRLGLDPDALRVQTEPWLPGWNALGRGLCSRFLQVVAERCDRSAAPA